MSSAIIVASPLSALADGGVVRDVTSGVATVINVSIMAKWKKKYFMIRQFFHVVIKKGQG